VEQRFSPRRIGIAVAAVVLVFTIGTVGFHFFLDEPWLQAFYRSIVTSSLTGLDTVPRNDAARLLSIFMVLSGLTIFAYVATTLVEGIASGVFTGALGERRKQRMIDRLRDHYIICGYGRVGRRVGEELRDANVPYVVLDFSEDALEAAREHNDTFVKGDGTEDEDLQRAGLERARGLVAASDSDSDNLYITLSARTARPELMIVARASDEDAAKKLKLAGADRVVQPYQTAGRMMANLMLKPQVTAFLDAMTTAGGPDLRFEEIEVTRACGQAGKTIRELRIREETGAMIVALRKRDGGFDTTPEPDARLDEGDVMIAAGTVDELRSLEELFAPRQAVAG
jgi:voltage-gated potassium channel